MNTPRRLTLSGSCSERRVQLASLCRPQRRVATDRRVPTQALFGWGKDPEKEREREEAFKVQQEVLKRRRTNSWQKEVNERRADVRRYAADPEYKKKVDEEKRARAKAMKEADPELSPFNIIIPLAPFGIPEFDLGERFDLRGKYIAEGYVDDDADFFKQIGKFFGGGRKKDDNQDKGKK